MDQFHKDVRYQTPEELAGVHYSMLMRDKQSAMELLSSPDYKIRLAAVLVCESTWNCAANPKVIAACRDIATSNAHDSFRICAIETLSRALSASKSPEASSFLAKLIFGDKNSTGLRVSAYWALREVQFGLSDTSFDNFLKGLFCSVKSILHDKPNEFPEEQVKAQLLARGHVPEELWNSAEEIDWDFVSQFATSE